MKQGSNEVLLVATNDKSDSNVCTSKYHKVIADMPYYIGEAMQKLRLATQKLVIGDNIASQSKQEPIEDSYIQIYGKVPGMIYDSYGNKVNNPTTQPFLMKNSIPEDDSNLIQVKNGVSKEELLKYGGTRIIKM